MRNVALLSALLLTCAPAYGQTTSGASSSVSISNPASTDSKARIITPPTVVAPGLAAAGMETCLGSATGGVSLMGIGFTFGKTTTDDGCTIRLFARQLHAFGQPKAAMALMCQDARVAEAMAAAGQPCPNFAAEIAPRRRQRVVEDVTGSIATPPSSIRTRGQIVVAWRNPDLIAAQERADETKVQDDAEERWFARASAVQ